MYCPHYGMFSKEGNLAVHAIVEVARKYEIEWSTVYFMLSYLARDAQFAEATDTAVKEYVYEALMEETV